MHLADVNSYNNYNKALACELELIFFLQHQSSFASLI